MRAAFPGFPFVPAVSVGLSNPSLLAPPALVARGPVVYGWTGLGALLDMWLTAKLPALAQRARESLAEPAKILDGADD